MTPRTTFSAIALLLLACSGEKAVTGPDPLATPSGFCVAWGEAACNEEVLDVCGAASVERCVESQADFCEQLLPSRGYDSRDAQQCLDAVEEAFRDADLSASELKLVLNLEGECSTLIRGDAEEGEACEMDTDCNTPAGFRCVALPGEEGTCQMPEVVGGGLACDEPQLMCDEDFFCNGDNCVVRREEGDDCVADSECEAELRCDSEGGAGGASGTSTCVTRGAVGDPCDSSRDCASEICVDDDGEGVCVSRVRLSQTGAICPTLR